MKPQLKPLNAKSNEFELAARTSLIALENNVATAAHLCNFFVLADICHRIGSELKKSYFDLAKKNMADSKKGTADLFSI